MSDLYNATARIVRRRDDAMVIRVYPDAPMVRYAAGQYGSLGLVQETGDPKIIKRPYCISSSIVDLPSGKPIDARDTDYYEFYFNLIESDAPQRERLTPKLFRLKDGDRIFCGKKITGHYTLDNVSPATNLLLVSTMTGEAPNNSITAQWLTEKRPSKVCCVQIGPATWESLYRPEHEHLSRTVESYRRIEIRSADYAEAERRVERWAAAADKGETELGFPLDPATCHVFLCGDPDMIGAPRKLGAWNYETPPSGLSQALSRHGFSTRTKFKQGNMDYETYW